MVSKNQSKNKGSTFILDVYLNILTYLPFLRQARKHFFNFVFERKDDNKNEMFGI